MKNNYLLIVIIGLSSVLFSSTRLSAQTNPDFNTAITANGCEIATYQFTDQSTNGGSAVDPSTTYYTWDFGNSNGVVRSLGTTPDIYNPSATYGSPGEFTVRLTIDFGDVNTQYTVIKKVVVYEASSPAFTADITVGCAPATINFLDTTDVSAITVGNEVSWDWNFGDGSAHSYAQNPAHTYNNPGSYQVTLTVETQAGTETCTGITAISGYITVNPSPTANLSVTNLPACDIPYNAQFQNNSSISTPSNITNYDWTFYDEDGSTVIGTSTAENPIQNYSNYGNYNAKLRVTSNNGCKDSLTLLSAVVINNNKDSFSISTPTLCAKNNILFLDKSSTGATSWLWDFDDAGTSTDKNPSHSFTNPGTYNVVSQATFSDGCTESSTLAVTILDLPVATYSVTPQNGLCKAPITFTYNPDNITASSYQWNFDDDAFVDGGTSTSSNPTHTYDHFASFNPKLIVTDANGCKDSSTVNIVLTKPTANFDVTSLPFGCAPQTVDFTSTSTAVEGISTWEWFFDGSTSAGNAGENPSNTYNSAGIYDVKLKITTINGCTDSITKSSLIEVGDPPTVDAISFDREGCRLDASLQGISFTPQFNITSSTVDSIVWDFGDGSTDAFAGPPFTTSHIYEQIGNMNVGIQAFNNGCPTSFTLAGGVDILGPISRFTSNSGVGCSGGTTITYNNTASIEAVDGVTQYFWDFGDGTRDTTAKSSALDHTYASPGNYTVRMTASNAPEANACSDYIENTVKITTSAPDFDIIPSNGQTCASNSVIFRDNSSTTNGTIVSWIWDLGDGTVITNNTNADVVHTYAPRATPYDITLSIQELDGCVYNSVVKQLTAYGPEPNFNAPSDACANVDVSFSDISSSIPGTANITSWYWDFKDPGSGANSTSTAQNPTHAFSSSGTYNVSLTVTDDNAMPGACSYTISKAITINDVNASFSTIRDKFCENDPGPIQFTNATTVTDASTLSYSWDFGDAGAGTQTGTITNPAYQYVSEGTFTVQMIATSTNGCKDTAQKILTIVDPQLFVLADGANPAPVYNCPPQEVQFSVSASAGAGITSYAWDFGDGNISSNQNPKNTYNFPGNYDIQITAISDAGCTVSNTLYDFITVSGPQGTFTFDKDKICYPEVVAYTGSSFKNLVTIQWDYGDGNTSPEMTLSSGEISTLEAGGSVTGKSTIDHQYDIAGIFNPFLVLKDNTGCKVYYPSPVGSISSSGKPTTNFSWTGGGQICKDVAFDFLDQSISDPATPSNLSPEVSQWRWNFYSDNTNTTIDEFKTNQNPSKTYSAAGDYAVELIAKTTFGCSDTLTKIVSIVTPAITADIQVLNGVVCPGEPVQVSGTNSVSNSGGTALALNYAWTFFDTDGVGVLGNSTDSIADFIYSQEGKYKVQLEVTDEAMCAAGDIDTSSIKVNPLPVFLQHPAAASICEGDNTSFTVVPTAATLTIGAVDYQWQVNDGGGWVDLVDGGIYSGSVTSGTASATLNLTAVASSYDNYQYRCEMTHTSTTTCSSYSNPAVLTVNLNPTVANAGPAQNVCDATSATMAANTPTVGQGTWTKISGPAAIINDPNLPTSVMDIQVGITTFQWEIANGVCPASTSTVIVKNAKSATAGSDVQYCNVSDFNLNGNNPDLAGGVGTWTKLSALAATISAVNTYNTAVTSAAIGTHEFEWAITSAPGCGDTKDTVVVTNYDLPTISGQPIDATICEGVNQEFVVTASPSFTFQWQVDDGGGAGFYNIGNGTYYNGTTNDTLTVLNIPPGFDQYKFQCIVTNPTTVCSTTSNSATLTVITAPANIVTDGTICSGESFQPVVKATNAAYTYTLRDNSNNVIEALAGNGGDLTFSAVSPTSTATYNIFVKTDIVNGDYCEIELSDKSVVTVSGTLPTTTAISGMATVCNIDTITYLASGLAGSSYNWSVPAGATIVSGQGTNTLQVDFGSTSGNVSVIETNTGCVGASVDYAVSVQASTPVTITANSPVCENSGIMVMTGSPTPGTFTGTGVSGDQFDPATAGVGIHTITYTYQDANACNNVATKDITVQAQPSVLLSDFSDVCVDAASFALSGGTPTAVGTGTYSGTGVSNNNFDPATAGVGTHTIRYTFDDGICSNYAEKTLTVNPLPGAPTVINVDKPQVCSNDGGNITLSAAGESNGTLTWYKGAVGGTSIGTGNSLTIPAPLASTTYYVRTENACGNSTDLNTAVTVNPAPNASATLSDEDICDGGSASISLNASENNVDYQLRLDADNSNIGSAIAGTGGIINFNVSPASSTTYNVLATNSITACFVELTDKPTVTVDNLLDNTIPLVDDTMCTGGIAGIKLNNSVNGVTYTLRYNSDNSDVPGQTISGNGAAIQFNVNPGSTTDYNVNAVVDATGCNGQLLDVATIKVLPYPSDALAVSDDEICVGQTGTIVVSNSVTSIDYSLRKDADNSVVSTLSGSGADINFSDAPAATTLYNIYATNGYCGVELTDKSTITVDNLPTAYNVTGGGSYCSGGSGVAIGIDGSENGVSYKLLRDGAETGTVLSGNGNALSFGDQTTAGIYTVQASNANSCSTTMTGSATITVDPLPSAPTAATADHTILCDNDGGNITLSATGGSGTNLRWYTGSCAGTLVGTTTDLTLAAPTTSTTYYAAWENACGVSSCQSVNITVNPAPNPTISSDAASNTICAGDNVTFTATDGSTYKFYINADEKQSGSGNTFSSTALSNGDIVYAQATNGGCAANSSSITMTVNPLPNTALGLLSNVCENGSILPLTSGTPVGGTYSGNGVSGSNFNPATAGAGAHLITYSYTDGNGCSKSAVRAITVDPKPSASIGTLADVCVNASSFALTTGAPSGGSYFGTGVSTNNFDAATAGTGTHTINYKYSDGTCSDTASTTITVNALPSVSFGALSDVCEADGLVTLSSGSPSGGSYSGTAVTGNKFDPATATAGTYVLTYNYTDGNSCSNSATQSITVNAAPTVTFAAISDLCANSAAITLTQGSPSGGTYSGTGVSGNSFDPSVAGVGTHLITYTYDNGTCSKSVTQTVTVNANPTVNLGTFSDVCANTAAFALSGESPAGGSFSGTGVSGGNFDPSVSGDGTFSITYTYTDGATSCSASASSDIIVKPLPEVSLAAPSDICVNGDPFSFSTSGGTLSGDGVFGTKFYPDSAGVGSHTISYTYTGANGCTVVKTHDILVHDVPTVSLGTFSDICSDAPAFALSSGTPGGGSYSGSGVSGTTFTPSSAGAGTHNIVYSYTDANSCTNSDTSQITVKAIPSIDFAGLNSEYCQSTTDTFTLTGTEAPNGSFTGSGILDQGNGTAKFVPSASGNYNITYSYDESGYCATTKQKPVTVNAAPNGSLVNNSTANTICTGTSIEFTATGGSIYNFKINGVSKQYNASNSFITTVLSDGDEVSAVIEDSKGCTDILTQTITVLDTPTVNYGAMADVCANTSPFVLSAATPAGGIYTGPGINGGSFDASLAGAGTHLLSYKYTDANGCSNTKTQSIKVNALPAVNYTGLAAEYCQNDAAVTLNGNNAPNGSFTGTGITDNGDGTASFDPSVDGTFSITYTYTDGATSCSNSSTQSVVVKPAPVAVLVNDAVSNTICAGSNIAFTGSGGSNYDFDINGSVQQTGNQNTFSTSSLSNSDVVNVKVTNSEGCSATASNTITVNALPNPTFSAVPDKCLNTSAFVLSQASPAGGTYSGSGVSSNSFDASTAGIGTHAITYSYTDGNNCTNTVNQTITVNPLPNVSISGLAATYCEGAALASISGNYSTGTFAGTGITDNNDGTASFNPSTAGTYSISYSYTDANACSNTAIQSVTVNAAPNASLSNNTSGNEICAGESVIFTASGGTNYRFMLNGSEQQNGSTTTFTTASLNNNDNVSVEVTDANSCAATTSQTITVNALPTMSLTNDATASTICAGESVTFTASGANTYVFKVDDVQKYSGSSTSYSNSSLTDGAVVKVIGTNTAGCSDSTSQTITVNPLPNVSLNSFSDVCVGSAAYALTGASPSGGSYSGTGVSGSNFDPSVAGVGTHSITYSYTDGNSCSNSAVSTITVNSLPTVSFGGLDATYCQNAAAVTLNGNNAPNGSFSGTGITDNSNGTASFNPSTAGTYDITYSYTDGNSCSNSVSQSVTVNPEPNASWSNLPSGNEICAGDNISFTATGGTSYKYYLNDVYQSNVNPYSSTTLSNGDVVKVEVTDASSCSASLSKTITVHELPSIGLVSDASANTICEGEMINFTASGAINYRFVKNSSELQNGLLNTWASSSLSDGDLIKVEGTSSNGCVDSAKLSITVNANPIINFGSLSDMCANSSAIILNTATPAGGVYSGTGVSNGMFNPVIAGIGNHNISYSLTNSNGCSASANSSVIVNPLPVVSISGLNSSYCQSNSSISIEGNMKPSGNFSGTGISDNGDGTATFTPSIVGTFNLSYTYSDVNSCSNTATENVVVNTAPNATLISSDADNIICQGESVSFTASGGVSYMIYVNGVLKTTSSIYTTSQLNNGDSVSVDVIASGGCIDSEYIIMTVNPLPVVTLSTDALNNTVCSGLPISFTASGGGNYEFSVNSNVKYSGNSNLWTSSSLLNNDIVKVIVTDSNQCVNQATQSVSINQSPVIVFGEIDNTCVNADAFALNTATPVGGTYSGVGVSNGLFDPQVSGAGTHIIKYSYTNQNSCSAEAYQIVAVNSAPTLSIIGLADEYCENTQSVTITGNYAPEGSFSGIGITDNGNGTAKFSPSYAGTYDILYTATSSNSCSNTVSKTVTVNAAPEAILNNTSSGNKICENESVSFSASNSDTYKFYLNDIFATNGDTYTTNILANGDKVTLIATSTEGCKDTINQLITVYDLPNPLLSNDLVANSLCEGQLVSFDASGGVSYKFLLNSIEQYNGTSGNWTSSLIQNGDVITVEVTNNQNCMASTSQTLTVHPYPNVSLAVSDTNVCLSSTANVRISNSELGTKYTLRLNTTDETVIGPYNGTGMDLSFGVKPGVSTVYNVWASTQYGCEAQLDDLSNVQVSNCGTSPIANYDASLTFKNTKIDISVLANDLSGSSDFDISSLEIMTGEYPENGFVSVNYLNGAIEYTPVTNYTGLDSFVYKVCNLDGFCDTAKVDVVIIERPEAQPDYAITKVNTPVDIDVTKNDFGGEYIIPATSNSNSTSSTYIPDLSSIKIPVDGYPAFGGVVIDLTKGLIKYTPTNNYVGRDSFIYEIATTTGFIDTAMVYIDIYDTNLPPTAILDTASTLEGVAVEINLFDNDEDVDGYIVASSLQIVANPLNGTVSTTSYDGRIIYTPVSGFVGIDEFIYQVCDNDGACDTAIVQINVLYNNSPPVAIDDSYETKINTPIDAFILSNDYDIDGNLEYGSLIVLQNPYNGIVLVDTITAKISYSPNTNFSGIDYFTYQICDDDGECDQARVVITISGINHPPITEPDFGTVEQGGSVDVNVLFNDNDLDNDLDTSSLIIISSATSGASISILSDGIINFNYEYLADFYGNDTAVYEICDIVGNCARDTVFVKVSPKNEYNLIIPQAFSPNGDGYNDVFEIIGIENYGNNTFTIYNRWGNLVYQKYAYNNEWDGKNGNSGKDLPVGTYYMVLDLGNGSKKLAYYIYLIR